MSSAPRSGLYWKDLERGPSLATPGGAPEDCVHVSRPPHQPGTTIFMIRGRIGREEVGQICKRARPLLAALDPGLVICDVSRVVDPDAATIDALARLQLTARRLGHKVRIRHASHQLKDLLWFTGLQDVVLSES